MKPVTVSVLMLYASLVMLRVQYVSYCHLLYPKMWQLYVNSAPSMPRVQDS